MSLRFLIIHESIVIRNIIQRYIAADYHEATIDLSHSAENAKQLLKERKYDLIFSGMEMAETNGIDLCHQTRLSGINQKTPMIIMIATDNQSRRRRFAEEGIHYILPIPFTSSQFRALLSKIFYSDVHGIPLYSNILKNRAIIQINGKHILAYVINISMDSVICELIYPEKNESLIIASQITVQFPIDYGRAIMINIIADLPDGLRISGSQNESFHHRPVITGKAVWKSFELISATKKSLKMSLNQETDLESKYLSGLSSSLIKENEGLRAELNAFHAEKQGLLLQISRLVKRIAELQKGVSSSLKDVSLSSLINEVAKRSDDPSKLPIFKRIIEDNVKLRDALKP